MTTPAICSGKPWLDTAGHPIQAHGGSLFYENGTFYFYGENKEKTVPGSKFWHYGVRAYSSPDLYTWKDEGILLAPVGNDVSHPLHPSRIMDRPHILFNARTKKYVMWMKFAGTAEAPNEWNIQSMGVAVADKFTGPYTFIKTFHPLGMNTGDFDFYKEASDGKAYFIFERVHTELVIADLTDDYLGVTGYYSSHFPFPGPPQTREAPAFFKRGSRYYMITSGTTGYGPNQADYAVSELVHGPWKSMGDPCIGDTRKTTFDSQVSSVFIHPHKKNLIFAVADRWNAENNSTATYVWLPLTVEGETLKMQWREEWRIEDFE
ncbi:MAG: family 43 glycosylhydrolase [Methylacidiphilales bacterium]|nr:family 43 glycosylhydrolase [Candidatus Methylacidiphilales bacterium]